MDNRTHKFSLNRVLIAIFALAGLAIMAYLTYIHYANLSSFCDISESVSCDVVTTSLYSEIFGLPVSLLGLGYFGLVLYLIFFRRGEKIFRTIFLITLFVLLPSLYLSLMELVAIEALCILCETSKLMMIAILITSFIASRPHAKVTGRMAAPVVIAGVVAAFVTFFAQTASTPTQDYTKLVECMNQAGVVYYKSVKCGNCKRQEKMLGEAYKKLNSVECHPEGPNPQVQLCVDKGVTKTPTFILEPEGVELDRLEGLQPIQGLADFANCEI